MSSPNILALVGAVAIAIGIGVVVEAANRQGKSYNQCQREARSLGWNINDEEDRTQAEKYIKDCQRGEYAEARQYRREGARRDTARRQSADWDRQALAQAQPGYRPYAVHGFEYCRDAAVFNGWNMRDESDIELANRYMANCMRGKIVK